MQGHDFMIKCGEKFRLSHFITLCHTFITSINHSVMKKTNPNECLSMIP